MTQYNKIIVSLTTINQDLINADCFHSVLISQVPRLRPQRGKRERGRKRNAVGERGLVSNKGRSWHGAWGMGTYHLARRSSRSKGTWQAN